MRRALCLGALVGLAACGSASEPVGPVPPGGPLAFVDASARVAAVITPADGGWLTTQGPRGEVLSLRVPPGSLLEDTEIALSPLTGSAGLPDALQFLAGVHFEPHGLRFLLPATLTIDLPGVPPPSLVGYMHGPDGVGFHLHPAESTGGRVTMQVSHFSDAGTAAADCATLLTQMPQSWTTPMDRALQRLGLLMLASTSPACELVGTEPFAVQVQVIFRDWFLDPGGLNELLEAAEESSDQLEEATGEFIAWASWLGRAWEEWSLDPAADPIVPIGWPVACGGSASDCSCTSVWDVLDCTPQRIWELVEKAVRAADEECDSGGDGDDRSTFRWIDFGCLLTSEADVYFPPARFPVEDLLQAKTCGLVTVSVDPPTLEMDAGTTRVVRVVARDRRDEEVPNYFEKLGRQIRWSDLDSDVLTLTPKNDTSSEVELKALRAGEVRLDLLTSLFACQPFWHGLDVDVRGSIDVVLLLQNFVQMDGHYVPDGSGFPTLTDEAGTIRDALEAGFEEARVAIVTYDRPGEHPWYSGACSHLDPGAGYIDPPVPVDTWLDFTADLDRMTSVLSQVRPSCTGSSLWGMAGTWLWPGLLRSVSGTSLGGWRDEEGIPRLVIVVANYCDYYDKRSGTWQWANPTGVAIEEVANAARARDVEVHYVSLNTYWDAWVSPRVGRVCNAAGGKYWSLEGNETAATGIRMVIDDAARRERRNRGKEAGR